jgi:hypothetical protein
MQFFKQTILSIFNFNVEEDNFVFVDHQNTYKRIHSVFACPQPHRYVFVFAIIIFFSLDCLLIITVNGEWLFVQWNKNHFIPLATGSIDCAIKGLHKYSSHHQYCIDPV